jgi:hypothetical protein
MAFLETLLPEDIWAPIASEHYRRTSGFPLSQLPVVASLPESPKFVFAHVLAPHPPFVFDADGEAVTSKHPTLADGGDCQGSTADYIAGYRDQIAYVDRILEEAIDGILSNSPGAPIIILQADHGPGALLDWESVEASCLWERMSILNAYHLPGAHSAGLYPEITPVNSFRVVFDAYFGTHLGQVEDRSYFSTNSHPYEFIEVNDRLIPCELPPESE